MHVREVNCLNDWLSKELVKEDSSQNTVDMLLHTRLCNLLSSVSVCTSAEFCPEKIEHGSEDILKEQLNKWLLQVSEDGQDPKVLDQDGQGAIHLASALGYDCAITGVVAAGVDINFRDVNGWTALHWAAFCGRERTVALLIVMDASLDAVTYPTLENPSGLTPYDLAKANGHMGMSGFLGGCCLKYLPEQLSLKKEAQILPKRSSTEYLNLQDTPQNALEEAILNTDTICQGIRSVSLESKQVEEDREREVVDPIIKIQGEEGQKFVRAVKIVEKYVLLWLKKRKGLCGFKQGRKQALETHQKALARVKSLAHCQGAWEQYNRLLKYFMELGKLRSWTDF